MKKSINYLAGIAVIGMVVGVLVAADHIDAPATTGSTADISDFFAFEPTEGSDNTVFVVDLQSNVMPELAYGTFDEEVLTEINIDTDGDLVEDMVIQAIPRDGIMYFFGPASPSQTGLSGEVLVDQPLGNVEISAATAITETTADGVSLFAGPRQDPFFFDFVQFNQVVAPSPENNGGFKSDGTDTFDGANTMAIIMELPNSMLGETTATNVLGLPVYKTWVTTNRKQ